MSSRSYTFRNKNTGFLVKASARNRMNALSTAYRLYKEEFFGEVERTDLKLIAVEILRWEAKK